MESQEQRVQRPAVRQAARAVAVAGAALLVVGCAQVPLGGDTASEAAVSAPTVAAAEVLPRSLAGSYLVGSQAMRQFDSGIAQQHIDFVLNAEPENRAVLTKAFAVSFDNNAYNRAFALARIFDVSEQKNPLISLALAVEDIQRRDYAAASKRLNDLPSSSVNRAIGPLLLAWVNLGQGRYDQVEQTLTGLSAFTGFSALTNLHRALIAAAAGEHAAAIEHFQTAGAHKPPAALRLTLAMATEFARGDNRQAALSLIESRDDPLLDREQVIAHLQRTDSTSPRMSVAEGAAEALFDIASALHRERQNGSALFFARLATYLDPKQALGYLLIGEIHESRAQLHHALDAYQSVQTNSPFRLMANLRRAETLDANGDKAGATAVLTAMMTRQAGNPEPAIRLGDLHRRSEDWPQAIAAYDTAIARLTANDQADWSVYYARGIALERAKLWPRAERDFLQALTLSPDQPYVMNYLGYSWTDQGINLDRAEALIEKAAVLLPSDGYIVDSLGWIKYRRGRFDEAVTHLERAAELRPTDPVINDHLGDAYWHAGRQNEARFQWRRAQLFDPDPELRERLQTKLRDGLTAAGSDDRR